MTLITHCQLAVNQDWLWPDQESC